MRPRDAPRVARPLGLPRPRMAPKDVLLELFSPRLLGVRRTVEPPRVASKGCSRVKRPARTAPRPRKLEAPRLLLRGVPRHGLLTALGPLRRLTKLPPPAARDSRPEWANSPALRARFVDKRAPARLRNWRGSATPFNLSLTALNRLHCLPCRSNWLTNEIYRA